MEFERIKQNFRFRSGRSTNQSKRFPTRDPEPEVQQSTMPAPHPATRRKKESTMLGILPSQPSQYRTQEPGGLQRSANTPVFPASKLDADSGEENFDLHPSSANRKALSLESQTDLLFSEGYLETITGDPQLLARFTSFLNRYKPEISRIVLQYIENQKVIKAVNYANAVAATIENSEAKSDTSPAAELSASFQVASQEAFNKLLKIALPAWVTYSLVKTSTACLTAEITNRSTPLTSDLVGGLSEVFCITDPHQRDNPIIYASEEFYRLTGYGKDNVIGYNCRFLQGSRTKKESVERLRTAIKKGEEICETLLNYRRDGKPFVNILMLAPLHNNRGSVKYYLGAQVDASRLVEGGRGVDGFERFLMKKQMDDEKKKGEIRDPKRNALEKLKELSLTFDLEESAVVQKPIQTDSTTRVDDWSVTSTNRTARRRIQDDDESPESDNDDGIEKDDARWKLTQTMPSGQLPGIYKKYVLIRPYPSLRAIFVSQAVRVLGQLQQSPFLAHIAAPLTTITGLQDAFQSGAPVNAKVAIMARSGDSRGGTVTQKWSNKADGPKEYGMMCWISATPLKDSRENVGVWMVIIIDSASVASNTGRVLEERLRKEEDVRSWVKNASPGSPNNLNLPIKPNRVGEDDPEAVDGGGLGTPNGVTNEALLTDGNQKLALRNVASAQSLDLDPDLIMDRYLNEQADGGGRVLDEASDVTPRRPSTNHQRTPSDQISDSTVTARPNGPRGGAPDVGLRAMDYLTSRSPVTKKNQRKLEGVKEEAEEDERRTELASPYSVD